MFVLLKSLLSNIKETKLRSLKHSGNEPLRLLLAKFMIFIFVLFKSHVIPK